jgi:hypothetical protein
VGCAGGESAVDDELGPRRIARFIAGEEQNEPRDLDRVGRATERDLQVVRIEAFVIGVLINPGWRELTRTRACAFSTATDFVKPRTVRRRSVAPP